MALIPLSPARMNVMREGNLVKYEYTHEVGKQEVFSAERIWHVKNMPISSSYNGEAPEGLVGISPIAASHEAVGLAMAADQYEGRYFANNAQVGLAFNYPGKLGENAKTFLKESLEKYAQMENKFRSIIVEEGGKIENLGITNEDSQFLESRQFQIEEICRIFGVYPILVGHPTNTMTYASAEQLFLAFGKFTRRGSSWPSTEPQSADKSGIGLPVPVDFVRIHVNPHDLGCGWNDTARLEEPVQANPCNDKDVRLGHGHHDADVAAVPDGKRMGVGKGSPAMIEKDEGHPRFINELSEAIGAGAEPSLANAVLIALAHLVSGGSTSQWLGWGLGFFVLGWIIQFLGHYSEGKKLVRRGRPKLEKPRRLLSLRLPPDVIESWKASGPGWQTRMAEVLERTKPKA